MLSIPYHGVMTWHVHLVNSYSSYCLLLVKDFVVVA